MFADKEKIKTLSIVALYECETSKQAQRVACGKSCGNYCPVCGSGSHKNKTGALALYVNSNSFYCYSCGAGGSVIDFVMYARKLNLNDAADHINKTYFNGLATKGNDAPAVPTYRRKALTVQTPAATDDRPAPDREVNGKLFELVSASTGCAACLAYLDGRGITADVRERWNIATVAPSDVASIATQLTRLFGVERLRAAGVLVGSKFFFGRHRILIFNRNQRGDFLNVRARALPSDADQYAAATGRELNKYNGTATKVYPFATSSIYAAPAGATVYLVEGEFDAVAANELADGSAAAVAIGGGGCDADSYAGLLRRIAAAGLKVCPNFDADDGGKRHKKRFERIAKQVTKQTPLIVKEPSHTAQFKDFGDILAAVNVTRSDDVASVETYFATSGVYSVADIATAYNWTRLRTRRAFMDAIKCFGFNASFADRYETIKIY